MKKKKQRQLCENSDLHLKKNRAALHFVHTYISSFLYHCLTLIACAVGGTLEMAWNKHLFSALQYGGHMVGRGCFR